jgi:hypothetical protein
MGLQVEACPWGDLAGLWSMGLAGLRGVGPAEIMQACESWAWSFWGLRPGGDPVGLWSMGLAEIVQACGLQACWAWGVEAWGRLWELQLHRPMGQGLACSTGYCVRKSWHGEAFHKLGVQSAEVLALPGALPQPIVFPASQQGPWFTDLVGSAAVSQLPSWIFQSISFYFTFL